MTLHIEDRSEIPAETAALVEDLLAEEDPYRLIGERLNDLLSDADFIDMYAEIGGPALSPALLSLVLVFQMLEKLPDRLAARAVKVRLDWKYALHLPLDYAGFHFTNLNHFRKRLIEHEAEYRVFDRLVQKLITLGLLRQRHKVRTDSSHILGAVAKLSRLELVLETQRVVLNVLEKEDLVWYQQHIPATYQAEYQVRREDYQLSEPEIKQLLHQAGADGWWLLQQLATAPASLATLAEVQTMRDIWAQQFEVDAAEQYVGARTKLESSGLIQTPHDPEVHYKVKRGLQWRGYKAQVTETAEAAGEPNFIVDIAATDAQLVDSKAVPDIQTRLRARDIQPQEQYVDSAYVTTYLLGESAAQGIDLRGPAPKMPSTGLFSVDDFEFDLSQRVAHCPAGRQSTNCSFSPSSHGGQEYVFFFGEQCLTCALRSQCTTAQRGRTVRYHQQRPFLERRLAEMETAEFWISMKRRPPVEGTISQLTRLGARQARYRGLKRVNLQLVLVGTAVNLKRLLRIWRTKVTPGWI